MPSQNPALPFGGREPATSRASKMPQSTDLAKNVFMAGLRDSNEVRFTGCWSTVKISPSP